MEENRHKEKNIKVIIPQFIPYQKEDKKLQEEQNKILIWNTKLALLATIFGFLAFLAQAIQIITDIILYKF
jgi:hypothetical protein